MTASEPSNGTGASTAVRNPSPHYGFPAAVLELLDEVPGIGPSSPCGICGDTILGQRHRIIDAITERLRSGDPDPGFDWDVHPDYVAIVVMASYEHDKALARQRRAKRKAAS